MGRFYKTSRGQLLDYTLKLPEEMMIKTVQYNDQMITKSMAAYDQYAKALQGQGLGTVDEQRMHDIFQGYQKQIDEGTKNLNDNVLEWRNQMPNIKKIGTDIYQDMTQGEWSKLQGNYNQFQTWSKSLDDMYTKNPDKYLDTDLQKLKTYQYLNWKGTSYDSKTGKSNTFQTVNPAEYFDIIKEADLLGSGFKADKNTTYYATPDGKYIREGVNSREEVTKQEVFNAVYNGIINNPKAQAYFKQQFDVNVGLGYMGKDAASEILKNSKDKTLRSLYNPNDDFANYMSIKAYNATIAPIEKYAYIQTEQGTKHLKADGFALENLRYKHKKALKLMESGGSDIITSGILSKTILDAEDFNPTSVASNVKVTQDNIDRLKIEIGKAMAAGDKSQVADLQNELLKELSLATTLSTFTNSAEAYAQGKLAEDGYNIDDLNSFIPVINKIKDAQYKYEGSLLPGNLSSDKNLNWLQRTTLRMSTVNRAQSVETDMTDKPTFIKVMKSQGYQNDEIEVLFSTYTKFNNTYKGKTHSVQNDYKSYTNEWYKENANSNKYDAPYVNLSTISGDKTFNNSLVGFLKTGMGIYVSDADYNPKSTSYNTKVKHKGVFGRIAKGKDFDVISYFNKKGIDLSKYLIVDKAEGSGTDVLVTYRIDTEKLKDDGHRLSDTEGIGDMITVKYDNRSGVGDYIRTYVTKNYTPGTKLVNQTLGAIGNTSGADVVQMSKLYTVLPYNATQNGKASSMHYTIAPFPNFKQDITVQLKNGIKEYDVIHYYKNKKDDWVPLADNKGNKVFIYNGDNAAMEISRQVIDMRNDYYGLPSTNLNAWQ